MPVFNDGNGPSKPLGSEVQQETIPKGLEGLARTITFTTDNGSLLGVKETSGSIAANATADTIQTALEAMTAFAPGDIKVTGSGKAFTYSFGGVFANKALKPMFSTFANTQKSYFESIVTGVSLAAQELIKKEVTANALGGYGDLSNSGRVYYDIGNPARYVGFGREYTEVLTATGGTRTLTVNGQTTGALAFNATAATIQAAIIALSNVAPGEVVVTSETANNFRYVFSGTLQGVGVALLSVTPASLTGGTSTVNLVREGTTPLPQG